MTLADIPTEALELEILRRRQSQSHDDRGISVRDAVAKAFEVPAFALYAERGTASISTARFACYLLLRARGHSLTEIATITRRKHHGSVLHGIRRAEWLIEHDRDFAGRFRAARALAASKGGAP